MNPGIQPKIRMNSHLSHRNLSYVKMVATFEFLTKFGSRNHFSTSNKLQFGATEKLERDRKIKFSSAPPTKLIPMLNPYFIIYPQNAKITQKTFYTPFHVLTFVTQQTPR